MQNGKSGEKERQADFVTVTFEQNPVEKFGQCVEARFVSLQP